MKRIFIVFLTIFIVPLIARADDCTGYTFKVNDGCYNYTTANYNLSNALTNGTTIYQLNDTDDLYLSNRSTISELTLDLQGHNIKALRVAAESNPLTLHIINSSSDIGSIDKLTTGYYSSATTPSPDTKKVTVDVNNTTINELLDVYPDGEVILNNCKSPNFGSKVDYTDKTYIKNYGYLTINSGTYNASKLIYNYNKLTINDGTFNGNVFYNGNKNVVNDSWRDNAATMTIKGGTFTSNSKSSLNVLFSNIAKEGTPSNALINIDGGTFKSANGYLVNNSNGQVNIKNGSSNEDNYSSPLFINIGGIINMDGGNFATSTDEVAIVSPSGIFNLNNGTIDIRKSPSVSVNAFNFGTEEEGKNPFIYIKSKTIAENFDLPSDDYKILYEKYKDGSYKVSLADKDTPDPKEYVLGDWNDDSKFNGTDIALYRKYFANAEEEVTIDGEAKKYTDFNPTHKDFLDVNDDKTLNLADLVSVRLLAAQLNIN